VSVPCTPPASTAWTTQATYLTPAPPSEVANLPPTTSTVTGPTLAYPVTGACGFKFSTISSPQTVGSPITFTVSEVDGAGNPASFYTYNPDQPNAAAPALTGTFGSAGGAPVYSLGTFRQCDCEFGGASAQGSATDFTPGRAQTLTVSLGSFTGTSNSFDVTGCAAGATTCTNSNVEGNTSLTLTFPNPPASPTAVIFTPAGTPYTCTGFGLVSPQSSIIGFDASQSADPNRPYSFANPVVATVRYSASILHGTGVPHFPFCIGPFASGPAVLSPAPDCPAHLTSNSQLPCVLHRDRGASNAGRFNGVRQVSVANDKGKKDDRNKGGISQGGNGQGGNGKGDDGHGAGNGGDGHGGDGHGGGGGDDGHGGDDGGGGGGGDLTITVLVLPGDPFFGGP